MAMIPQYRLWRVETYCRVLCADCIFRQPLRYLLPIVVHFLNKMNYHFNQS